MVIFVISVLYALLVFSPYIVGVLQQPPGTTFTGAVHYPLDYYYYLSYMAQGKFRWFTSFYISTSESITPVFYHWLYVFSGRIFSLMGISNMLGYQLLILGATITLLFASYRLIRTAIPSRAVSTIAYLLFLTSNTLPGYWSWYNYGEPFIRFSSIPHHLVAQTVLVAILLLLVQRKRSWALFLVAGFLLASTQTPLVLIVLVSVAFFAVQDGVSSGFLPALLLLAAGAVPYTVYLRTLFAYPPFSAIVAWEAGEQVHMTLLKFFQTNGPVVLLGAVGVPLFLSGRTRVRQLLVLFTIISWGIFLSPIPAAIGVLNVRFLSVVPTLTMACAAAALIDAFAKRFRPSFHTVIRVGVTILVLAFTVPPTIQQAVGRASFEQGNAFSFLPNTVLDAYVQVQKRIPPADTCLVIWPFHISFTGLTGRRAFTVNQYATLNFEAKEREVTAFFSDATPVTQKSRILASHGISCVLTYSFTKNLPPALIPLYTNSYMTLYKVTK